MNTLKWIVMVSVLFCQIASAALADFYPDFFKTQYAGGIGRYAAGLGYTFANEKFDATLIYGYVPPMQGGAQVHTIALRSDDVWRTTTYSPGLHARRVIGLTATMSFAPHTFVVLPDSYPENYYPPNCFQLILRAGNRYLITLPTGMAFRAMSVDVEVGTLGSSIVYAFKESDVRASRFSLALGNSFYF